MTHLNKQLTLFLFCMLAIGYHYNAIAASAPYLCPQAIQMYGPRHKAKTLYPMLRPMGSENDDSDHDHTPQTILPTIYEKMQLNGDKEALTSALNYLEKKSPKGCWPSFGIKEIKEILNSPLTNYLHSIRTDDLAKVKTKIERLRLAISQGASEQIRVYNAAINIYTKRCDHAPIQEDDEKEEAPVAQDKNIVLAAVAAQKEIELAKQQLLVQVKKIIHPLERKRIYDQIDDLEKRYRDLSISDFSYNQAHLEQEKQALLKQAKRIVHTLEREQAYCQADVIEAAIQALALRVE